jgi:LPS-assembly protein
MQRVRRAPDLGALRYRLMTGAAAVAWTLLAGNALAQVAPAAAVTTGAGPDGLTPDAIYIEADSTVRTGDVITADSTGADRVLARFRDATLRAGTVSYDLGLGIASADRQVEFSDPAGNVVFASHLELDADLRAGVAVDFATRFSNGASLMAATAVRRSENVNQLNYALFTPCPICDAARLAR